MIYIEKLSVTPNCIINFRVLYLSNICKEMQNVIFLQVLSFCDFAPEPLTRTLPLDLAGGTSQTKYQSLYLLIPQPRVSG